MKSDPPLSPDADLPLAPEVTDRVKQYLRDVTMEIVSDAKMIAWHENAQKVQLQHLVEAQARQCSKNRNFWSKDLFITFGGAFFGAFVQGFITEINSGNLNLVVIYVILGIVGMILLFLGLARRVN